MADERDVILFKDLHVNDKLLLETGRSTYRFTLVNVGDRRGMLLGGKVDHEREVIFSGSIQASGELWEGGIKRGSRATFFLIVPDNVSGYSQVVTSPLTKLRLVRGTLTLGSEMA